MVRALIANRLPPLVGGVFALGHDLFARRRCRVGMGHAILDHAQPRRVQVGEDQVDAGRFVRFAAVTLEAAGLVGVDVDAVGPVVFVAAPVRDVAKEFAVGFAAGSKRFPDSLVGRAEEAAKVGRVAPVAAVAWDPLFADKILDDPLH